MSGGGARRAFGSPCGLVVLLLRCGGSSFRKLVHVDRLSITGTPSVGLLGLAIKPRSTLELVDIRDEEDRVQYLLLLFSIGKETRTVAQGVTGL